MVGNRIRFGQLVTLAFAGNHVQELRPVQQLDVLQSCSQSFKIMAIDRADVVETEFFKQSGRQNQALGLVLKPARQLKQRRRVFQNLATYLFGGGVKTTAHQLRQIAVQRTDGRADGHVVVVQYDQHVAIADPGVIHRLKRHAGGHGAVADDGHTVSLLAFLLCRHGHA